MSDSALPPPAPAPMTVPVPAAAGAPKAKRPRGARSICAALCLVLAAVLMPLGVVGYWGQRTLTDTSRFVETIEPAITSEVVQDELATVVANAVLANVDVDKVVAEYLPPVAAPLAGPMSSALSSFVENTTKKILASPKFQQIFINIASTLQQAIIKALSGESDGAVSLQGDQIVLDTGDLISEVQQELGARGLTSIANAGVPPAADRQIVLLNSSQVAQARTIYAFSVPIATYLILIVLLLFAGAIALSRRRARMVGLVGMCVVIASAVLLIGLSFAGTAVASAAAGGPFDLAVSVFYSTLTHYLVQSSTFFLILGLLIWFGGWAASGQKYAVAGRTFIRSKYEDRHGTPPAPPAPPAGLGG